MKSDTTTADLQARTFDLAETRLKNYLSNMFGVTESAYYASEFGKFLFENFPELFMDENLYSTTELIKDRVKRAKKEGGVSYLGFRFSKFKKVEERILLSHSHRYWGGAATKILSEQTLQQIKKEALYLLVKVPVIDAIFKKNEFYYDSDYCYDDEREINLDMELDAIVNSNKIEKLEKRIREVYSNSDALLDFDIPPSFDRAKNTALFLFSFSCFADIFEKYGVYYGSDWKNVDEPLLDKELDEKIVQTFKKLADFGEKEIIAISE